VGAMGVAIYVDRNSSGERSGDDLDAAIARLGVTRGLRRRAD
jgi:hypothetical protein